MFKSKKERSIRWKEDAKNFEMFLGISANEVSLKSKVSRLSNEHIQSLILQIKNTYEAFLGDSTKITQAARYCLDPVF